MIAIRVDGNEIIATGHVMRCLSIAEQIRKFGVEVRFVLADDRPGQLIRNQGFEYDVLDTTWNQLDLETEQLCKYLQKREIDTMLLDTYYVTQEYLQNISHYTKIVYIDDLRKFAYPVHTVINYGAWVTEDDYDQQGYYANGQRTQLLIGSQYVPLRDEFRYREFRVNKKVKRVLITTGGTDILNVAGGVLDELLHDDRTQELEYHVIVGCFNQNRDLLYSKAKRNNNIFLHENVSNMAEWMRNCDVAISAAGTTTYELCACGIPSICLEIADNQEGAIAWEENGYMLYAGNAYKNRQLCMDNCRKYLVEYQNNYELRKEKSLRMQSLIDGLGAERIAQYLINGGVERC